MNQILEFTFCLLLKHNLKHSSKHSFTFLARHEIYENSSNFKIWKSGFYRSRPYCGARLFFFEVIFKKWKTQTCLFLALKKSKKTRKNTRKKINGAQKWSKIRSRFLWGRSNFLPCGQSDGECDSQSYMSVTRSQNWRRVEQIGMKLTLFDSKTM